MRFNAPGDPCGTARRSILTDREPESTPSMRTLIALVTVCLVTPPALHAQEAADVLQGLRSGGGWVRIPIEAGVGSMRTATMPTMGMTLAGCVNVWTGHSGEWEIRAHDSVTDSVLVVHVEPGVGVPFAHTFGLQAQLDFDFRWSEPRDTTLTMWVGLALGKTREEACRPVFGG